MSTDPRVFNAAAVAAIENQFRIFAKYERPILWQHATLPEFAALRTWIDKQLAGLDARTTAKFLGALRDVRGYSPALAELATAYVFRKPGNEVEYDPHLGELTPDLLVTAPDGRRLIVEVWRRGLPLATDKRNKNWIELARHVRRIRAPKAIAASSMSHSVVEPPDAPARRHIEQKLRVWLASEEAATTPLDVEGLTFRVVGTTNHGRAEMLPVQDGATADRKDVVEAIERKVSKYRRAVDEIDLPLLVVLSADPGTALNASLVGHILEGNNTTSISIPINAVGPIDSGPIQLRQTNAPPTFDAALSGVAWLEINNGVDAVLEPFWPNPSATRPTGLQDPDD